MGFIHFETEGDPRIAVSDGVKRFDGDYGPCHRVYINDEPVTDALTAEGAISATLRIISELDKAVEYLEGCVRRESENE